MYYYIFTSFSFEKSQEISCYTCNKYFITFGLISNVSWLMNIDFAETSTQLECQHISYKHSHVFLQIFLFVLMIETFQNQSLQFIGLLVQSKFILSQKYQLYCFKILALLFFVLFCPVISLKVILPIKVMAAIKEINSWSIDL